MSDRASSIDLSEVGSGLSEPVFDSQCCFRALLRAMARPGVVSPSDVPVDSGGVLPAGVAAAALSLFDSDTPVWLSNSFRQTAITSFLQFHTGCTITENSRLARFALVSTPDELPELSQFDWGSDETPDQSATVIMRAAVTRTSQASSIWSLSGPGIDGQVVLSAAWLSERLVRDWTRMNHAFPRGLDLIVSTPEGYFGLPRSVRVQSGGAACTSR